MSLPNHVQEMVNAAVRQDEESKGDKIVFKTESEAIMAKSSAFADSFLHAPNETEENALIAKHCSYGNDDLIAVREIYLIALCRNFEFITTFEKECDIADGLQAHGNGDETDPPEISDKIETNLYLMQKITGLMRRIYDHGIKEDQKLLAQQAVEDDAKTLKTSTVHVAGVTADGTIHQIQ